MRFVITAFLFYSSSAYLRRQIAREYVWPSWNVSAGCFLRADALTRHNDGEGTRNQVTRLTIKVFLHRRLIDSKDFVFHKPTPACHSFSCLPSHWTSPHPSLRSRTELFRRLVTSCWLWDTSPCRSPIVTLVLATFALDCCDFPLSNQKKKKSPRKITRGVFCPWNHLTRQRQ